MKRSCLSGLRDNMNVTVLHGQTQNEDIIRHIHDDNISSEQQT